MAKNGITLFGLIGIAFCVILLGNQMVETAPALYDYDNLRDLYEILLRNEALQNPSQFVHQMERKGGRSPTLRLRFGRRADPLWNSSGPISSDSASEKVSFN